MIAKSNLSLQDNESFKIFNELISKYINIVNNKFKSRHCQLESKEDNEFFKSKLSTREKVKEYLKDPTLANFKKFWDNGVINAAKRYASPKAIYEKNKDLKEKITGIP